MKEDVSHDGAFPTLDALALDALDADERDAVLRHVRGCVQCQAELESLEATAAELAFVAAGHDSPIRSRVRSRLVARASVGGAGADEGVGSIASAVPPTRESSRSALIGPHAVSAAAPPARDRIPHLDRALTFNMLAWRRAEWVALAASVLLVVSIGVVAAAMKDRDNMRDALAAQLAIGHSATTASDSLRVAIASRDSLIVGLTGRNVAVMSLTSTGANAPFARMFWDQQHNTWTLIAHNMPALKLGRTYQLWLVTGSAKISAGTFDPHNGDAVVRATYALAPAQLRALAITEEATGGAPQPTSAPIIAVSAQ